mgnify:CR=1 FL=1
MPQVCIVGMLKAWYRPVDETGHKYDGEVLVILCLRMFSGAMFCPP